MFAAPRGDIEVSFEFFPPKSDKMAETLWQSIETLAPLRPRFVSVTYGAGGSTRERTHATVERLVRETDLTPAAHLTCVGASRGEIDDIARSYWDSGVRHIVALRGDPPEPGQPYAPHPQGYANAAELVAGLKKVAPFEISVAAYPEVHPDSDCPDSDLDNLIAKIDAGADRAISQFFFSADNFFRFRDRVAARGVDIEIVPGILPVSNVAQTRKFAGSAAPPSPTGWTACSKGSTTCPRRATWSPRRSPANCAASFMPAGCASSISTRSTAPSSPTPSAICSE